jgi:hypothetical protein
MHFALTCKITQPFGADVSTQLFRLAFQPTRLNTWSRPFKWTLCRISRLLGRNARLTRTYLASDRTRFALRVAWPDGTEVRKSHAQQCGLDLCNCRLARIAIQIIPLCLSTVHAPTVSRLIDRSSYKREADGEETFVVTRRLCLASELQGMAT